MTPEEQMELNYFYEEMESYYDEESKPRCLICMIIKSSP
ncbi:Uncharacterised protein [Streptococcus pneumoniae]|nr:Uncharacterised protein [Streptococcus pneumoniae]VSB00631.1 Uncharacterised protein [Streptococcus pneumoniae]VSB30148.1 Uncharacterised protein [Streptococcus pneumoniae]VSB35661.1 Uncharacterised protein [Streptococcus pneumoniae]VSB51772.1 Uncharacterised protein [Streptococcus pneumoniae]